MFCNSLKEWDSFTGECIRTYLWHNDDGDFDVFAVSPDGKRLAAGGNGIIKWCGNMSRGKKKKIPPYEK